MPIYDYRCDHCGHVFSARQGFDEAALERCPSCAKKPRRLVTAPSIVFKGSGWYKTDSRAAATKAEGSAAKAEGSAAKAEGSAAKAEGSAAKAEAADKPAKGDKKEAAPAKGSATSGEAAS